MKRIFFFFIFSFASLISMDAPQPKPKKGTKLLFGSQIAMPDGKDIRLLFNSDRGCLRFIEFSLFTHVTQGIMGGPEEIGKILRPYSPNVRIWGITNIPRSNIYLGVILAENNQQKRLMLYIAHGLLGATAYQFLNLNTASLSNIKAYQNSIDQKLIHLCLMLKQSKVITKVNYDLDLNNFVKRGYVHLSQRNKKNSLMTDQPTKLT